MKRSPSTGLWGEPPEKKKGNAFRVKTTESMIKDSLNIEKVDEPMIVISRENKRLTICDFSKCTHGHYSIQGSHHDNEDRSKIQPDYMDLGLYAIFDGHGGFKCAEWMEESLPSFISNTEYWKKEQYADALKQGFLDAEKAFLERAISIRDPTGTCVLMSLFHNKTKTVYIANVGDSRAVLSRGGKAIDLSRDHKADSAKELSRINQKGGRVVNGRVNGLLAVARSLGDKEMKIGKNKGPVTPYPEISKVEITSDDEFIILASDGYVLFFF